MARGSCTFRQRDVTAAVKAVAAAGCKVARVELDTSGKLVLVIGEPEKAKNGNGKEPDDGERNEWDEE
jgi:hypothetical protein